MQSQFTDKAQNALAQAGRCARGLKQGYIGTEHILVGLLKEESGVAAKVLMDNGVEIDQVMEMIRDLIAFENGVAVKDREGYSPRAARILEEAHRQAARFGQKQTGTEHLLLALIKEGENVAVRLLNTLGANVQKIYVDTLIAIGQDGNLYKEDLGKKGDRKAKQSTLEQYSRDLTALAREGRLDPVVGREEEIRRVVQILSRRTKNNPCLVGEPGVGKTAVVEGLAARIVAGDVPFTVQNKRVLTLDLSGMVAGSKYRGEFEERIKKVLKEVTEDGNIILFLDELHTIIGAGGAEGAIDASNIMKPSLARGEIQLIGATTIAEYRKYIEKDAALERRFQPVTVEEPTEEEAVRILEGIKGKYEDHHHVQITPEAIEAAVRLSSRYINDRNLPDKAIDLIDEASASARLSALDAPDKAKEIADRIHEMDQEMERAIRMEAFDQMAEIKKKQDALVKKQERLLKKREKREEENTLSIGENEIAEVVAQWTKIPVQKLAEKESERLLKLEKTLHKRVIGQDEAKKVLSVAVYNHYKRILAEQDLGVELQKSNILMLGPTGSGKTYLVKTLARLLDVPLALADATSLTEAGYIGDDIESVISKLLAAADNDVERAERGIVFIDEIDKIAKKKNTNSRDVSGESVQQGMLRLLEGADVEVPVGANSKNAMVPLATINTRNILFICGGAFPDLEEIIKQRLTKQTSIGFNAELKDRFDNDRDLLSRVTVEDLKKFGMIPEFLGRLPVIYTLKALDRDMLVKILMEPKNAILKQYQKLLSYDGAELVFDHDALEEIADKAIERNIGARGLRAVMEGVLTPIMYDIPSDHTIEQVTITAGAVDGKEPPQLGHRKEALQEGKPAAELPPVEPAS